MTLGTLEKIVKHFFFIGGRQYFVSLFGVVKKLFTIFFNEVKRKAKFTNFLRENEHGSPHILLQISIPNIILQNIYIFYRKM